MSDDDVFSAVLDLETEVDQRGLLESLCSHDSAQLERVWSLLETHRTLRSQDDKRCILDRPEVVFQSFLDSSELKPGKRVGDYILGELIGHGATSLVFRARQLKPVERDVALKILKPGMDSQRILARFGLEHQVIKRLEHPGVISVYDVGVQDNGRPFFAMELVPNPLTITQYAERFNLELVRRIQLLIATCEIVQHAHQRGVIHRDLKPSNILIEDLVQPHPKPRIIDFGIAKVVQPDGNSDNFTTLGDRFGTPAYMSPEQALMPTSSVDIRSDVYSLGVVLYELITGYTPRGASNNTSTEQLWTSEAYWEYETQPPSRVIKLHAKPPKDPTSPRSFLAFHRKRRSVEAEGGSAQELDWITLKAIARDRQDRYQTVADLQRDLQRFLNGEPVEAAGPGFLYRAKKFVMRNRSLSIATMFSLMTILITSVLTTSYAFRANEAEQQVRLQMQEIVDAQKGLLLERDRAEEALHQSQSLLRVFQVQTVTNHALARFLRQTMEAGLRGQIDGQAMDSQALLIEVEVLTKPHDRLIVKGDWTWASSRFPDEIINTSFQISSREAARAMPPKQDTQPKLATASEQQTEQATPSSESQQAAKDLAAQDRESLQNILLEELRKLLPNSDPFIAEILDNCGLQALDRHSPSEAAQFLTESVSIWEKSNKYQSNLSQSQLFLIEALLQMGQTEQATSWLDKANLTLASIPELDPHVSSLREFYSQLRTQSKMPQ